MASCASGRLPPTLAIRTRRKIAWAGAAMRRVVVIEVPVFAQFPWTCIRSWAPLPRARTRCARCMERAPLAGASGPGEPARPDRIDEWLEVCRRDLAAGGEVGELAHQAKRLPGSLAQSGRPAQVDGLRCDE